eukprot:926268-Rhodomonas_salina.1
MPRRRSDTAAMLRLARRTIRLSRITTFQAPDASLFQSLAPLLRCGQPTFKSQGGRGWSCGDA